MKHNEFSLLRFAVSRRAPPLLLLMLVGVPFAPAFAVDLSGIDGWRSLLPKHAGWALLAGLGLLAVAVAALTVRRKATSDDDEPLGRMRVEDQPSSPADPAAEAQPDVAAPAVADPSDQAATPEAITPLPPAHDPVDAQPPVPANDSQLFLALHHVDLSIDVLRRHLQRESRPMPAVWLMLLDLCRTHGREQTFRDLALEFHRRFNVCTPAWDGFPPGRDDPGLEAYPRLVKEITAAWGTHECRRLLERLLYDNRGAQRKGFTLNAYNDLIALRRAADAVLDSIEKDLAEESKVRTASASASASASSDAATSAASPSAAAPKSPLVSELESELDSDLHADVAPQSAIEREHPALAGMLAREWGNAAITARLCDMLSRGGDSTHAPSKEASEEIELLRKMAERLAAANGIAISTSESD